MKVLVDAFGGDNAPLEIIKGCILCLKQYEGLSIGLVGNRELIEQCAKEHDLSLDEMQIFDAPDRISMEDEAGEIMKSKKNSSMAVGLQLLAKGEGDAFLSAGNSGALIMGATLIVKRIKGVKRPAFAPVMPSSGGPVLLIDSGANIDVRPDMLQQFGVMGSVYMENVLHIQNPRVALANVGTEDHKGGELQHEAFRLLKNSGLNFIGNMEARDFPAGACDVIVADGFTGNIIIKMYEGVAKVLLSEIKGAIYSTTKSKIGGLLIKDVLKGTLNKFDVTRYGGAPLLGLKSLVVKMHGSAKAAEVENAIYQCIQFHKEDITGKTAKYVEEQAG